jgi:hypothetical protein
MGGRMEGGGWVGGWMDGWMDLCEAKAPSSSSHFGALTKDAQDVRGRVGARQVDAVGEVGVAACPPHGYVYVGVGIEMVRNSPSLSQSFHEWQHRPFSIDRPDSRSTRCTTTLPPSPSPSRPCSSPASTSSSVARAGVITIADGSSSSATTTAAAASCCSGLLRCGWCWSSVESCSILSVRVRGVLVDCIYRCRVSYFGNGRVSNQRAAARSIHLPCLAWIRSRGAE